MNLDKCEFAMLEAHFLGFIVGNNGVKTDKIKLKQYEDGPHQSLFLKFVPFLASPTSIGGSYKILALLQHP